MVVGVTGGDRAGSDAYAEAYGIDIGHWSGTTNTLTYTGSMVVEVIGAEDVGGKAYAKIFGIKTGDWLGTTNTLAFTNSMVVEANGGYGAIDNAEAVADGIQTSIWSGTTNTLNYTGSMTVGATGGEDAGGDADAYVSGIYTSNWTGTTNRFVNFGALNIYAYGGTSTVSGSFHGAGAFGIDIDNLSGTDTDDSTFANVLQNHGYLTFHAQSTDTTNDSYAYGIEFDNVNSDSHVLNTGAIHITVNAPLAAPSASAISQHSPKLSTAFCAMRARSLPAPKAVPKPMQSGSETSLHRVRAAAWICPLWAIWKDGSRPAGRMCWSTIVHPPATLCGGRSKIGKAPPAGWTMTPLPQAYSASMTPPVPRSTLR